MLNGGVHEKYCKIAKLPWDHNFEIAFWSWTYGVVMDLVMSSVIWSFMLPLKSQKSLFEAKL